MQASLGPYRSVLLITAASVAALAGAMLLPAAASAQHAGAPVTPKTTLALTSATVAKDPVTISASFAQLYVNVGSTDTLSGVASYVSGGTSHPLANSPLSITFDTSGAFNPPPVTTTVETAADGSFSYVTPEIGLAVDSAEVTVSSAPTAELDAAQISLSFTVNQEAVISHFSGHLTAYRRLRLFACGGIPEPLADAPLVGTLEYQYSRSRHGPWKTLGTGKYDVSGQCLADADGGTYPGNFRAPLASAYYRAYAPAVPGQMSAVSNVIHLSRDATRITGFTVTPSRVRRGRRVTVSGRLWVMHRRWTRFARQKVAIEYRYRGRNYVLSRRLRTNRWGRFIGSFRVWRTAFWIAVYNGGRNAFACVTKAFKVVVR